MAINVTLGEAKTQTKKPFPKLMISGDDDKRIILFTDNEVGVVVQEGNPYYGIGYYFTEWNMIGFTDYNEPITIQNA